MNIICKVFKHRVVTSWVLSLDHGNTEYYQCVRCWNYDGARPVSVPKNATFTVEDGKERV